jgi:3-oxoacyl-[acyl-carrier-protein] synthase II
VSRRRVVITGIGAITPFGRSVSATWRRLVSGESSVRAITLPNAATGVPLCVPAAPVEGTLEPLEKSVAPLVDKFTWLGILAARDAFAESNLKHVNRSRCGVSSGTCMGGITETERGFDAIYVQKRPRTHPFTVIRTMYNGPAAFIAQEHDLTGPTLCYSTTCSSSSVAIGEAMRQIRHGYADVMIAGGSETLLTYSAFNIWASGHLLAAVSDVPAQSCRPFSANRDGTALGEGAVFLVLEAEDHARSRGARVYAELAGYGIAGDCAHVTQPSVDGQSRPMRLALDDAGSKPEQVDYIQAHGTGTRLNDVTEVKAIKQVFGAHAMRLAVSSCKAQVGHMVGAAGAMGALIGTLAIHYGEVPPTAFLSEVDPECDLDFVPNVGRRLSRVDVVMTNAFGFGGTGVSLVFRRYDSGQLYKL